MISLFRFRPLLSKSKNVDQKRVEKIIELKFSVVDKFRSNATDGGSWKTYNFVVFWFLSVPACRKNQHSCQHAKKICIHACMPDPAWKIGIHAGMPKKLAFMPVCLILIFSTNQNLNMCQKNQHSCQHAKYGMKKLAFMPAWQLFRLKCWYAEKSSIHANIPDLA